MTKNVLITGAFGFVGTNLSTSIHKSDSAEFIAVDINEPNEHAYNEYLAWDDLRKAENIKIDAIIHLAGKAHDTKNTTVETEYFDINVGLTQRIFEFYLKSNATKFIFFSSVKAVADRVIGEQLTGNESPNPETAYGKSKLAAENYILNQILPEGKKIYILRPCMIHGPGNKGNLNLLFKFVKSGIPWPLGRYDNKRSFTSIENLSFVMNEILERDIEPGIYQMADDEVLSTNRLIQLIAESKGKESSIWYINKKMIQGIAKLGDVLRIPLNSERLKKLTESYVVSNIKIKKALGIEKMPVNAEEGMKKTLKSFK